MFNLKHISTKNVHRLRHEIPEGHMYCQYNNTEMMIDQMLWNQGKSPVRLATISKNQGKPIQLHFSNLTPQNHYRNMGKVQYIHLQDGLNF